MRYSNPVIPGFYPDPSICRNGDDYYLVTSSFEFFPGLPLFHSKNLTEWEQIGHVLTRKSQIMLEHCQASGGIWAPTIRLYKGRFYVSATNYSYGGNFIVWTDDIYGEWSDPVWIDQGGIDPSLFFDDDGKVYFSSTYDLPDSQAIGQCEIDIATGRRLTDTRIVWEGSGGKYPEGPHMYKRGGRYYMLAAEGGTEYGHMVTICRGTSPWGPFENCPYNPILTHRDTKLHHFQAVGHGDITETGEGESWIVFHGIRTSQYMLHHLGRETMLAPLDWREDGWPVVNGGNIILPEMETDRKLPGDGQHMKCGSICSDVRKDVSDIMDFSKSFSGNRLPPAWSYLRNPDPALYDFCDRPGCVKLTGCSYSLNDCESPAFIGRRQQHFRVEVQVRADAVPEVPGHAAGLTVFHTNEHHYDLMITERNGERAVLLRKVVGDMQTEVGCRYFPGKERLYLSIDADKLEYRFFAGTCEGNLERIGTGRTQLLSTECMPMTFTGCFFGLFAESGITAWFDRFQYHPL